MKIKQGRHIDKTSNFRIPSEDLIQKHSISS